MIKPFKIADLVQNSFIKILFFSIIFVSTKWYISSLFYDENINFKIFLDAEYDDYYYYPYIKYLSELSFNLSFDQELDNLKFITIPFHTIIIHTIFFKVFGSWSIILLQILFFSLVVYFFYYYLIQIKIDKNVAIVLSFLLFLFPKFIEFQNIIDYVYLDNLSLYNLRFPNALVTKFFFYLFVYLLIKFDNKYNNFSNFEKKDILILSIVFSFLLGSYYYFFIISSLAFIIFLFYKNKFSLSFIVDNFKKIALLALLFIIFSIPTILNTLYVEPDYLERLGIFEIDLNKKKEILKYIFNKFTKIDFIALLLLTFSLNWIINLKKFSGYKLTNILNILLISSIMSPVIFFIISPITLHISSFFAMIINLIFLNIFIQGIIFFKSVINFIFLRFNTVKFLILIVIILTFNYNYFLNSYNSNVKNNEYNDYRNELFLIIKEIKSYQSTNPNAHILTFDRNLQIWSIMNDIKFIIPLSGQVVPKTHNHIEDDLIDTFKFFNLDVEDFVNFLSVKKMNFRYTNAELQNYFWGRYTANSLKTYNDSEDFDDEVLFNIKNTALIYHQNLAIPNFELKRLKKKFLNNQINHKFSPDIIVLNETFVDRAIIPENYCLKKDFKKFNYFLVKKSNDCD